MKSLSLIIIQKTDSLSLLSELQSLDLSQIQTSILWLAEKHESHPQFTEWASSQNLNLIQIPLPEDELFFKDVLLETESEFVCLFNTSLKYPSDYFQRTINKPQEEEDKPVVRKGSLMERVLKATQQSKYGLGILKKDIKRNFSDLNTSLIYKKEDLKSANVSELSVDEELPIAVLNWANKAKTEAIKYHPDYQKIEYYQTLDSFISKVKTEAPKLSFRNKENASGLPIYLLLLVWISLILTLFFPISLLLFLVLLAMYFLAISLESLAISTIKRQGELFIGLLFFLPFLHHVYLFSYFSSLVTGKKAN